MLIDGPIIVAKIVFWYEFAEGEPAAVDAIAERLYPSAHFMFPQRL
jgi:hypothetical protein